jgi:hypothetical protein
MLVQTHQNCRANDLRVFNFAVNEDGEKKMVEGSCLLRQVIEGETISSHNRDTILEDFFNLLRFEFGVFTGSEFINLI